MRLTKLKIPMNKVLEFCKFCESMDIKVLCTFQVEDLLADSVVFIVRADFNSELPQALKEEKLKEKFGNFIKDSQ